MTGLCQPLDVALNRRFQEFFDDKFDEYVTESLNNGSSTTKKGNIKIPLYLTVSKWVQMWALKQSKEKVAKTFIL